MSKGTKTTLVEDLNKILEEKLTLGFLNDSPPILALRRVIVAAKRGDYHDFESELDTPTPKMKLVKDLEGISFKDLSVIINKVKGGDYDENPFEGGSNERN